MLEAGIAIDRLAEIEFHVERAFGSGHELLFARGLDDPLPRLTHASHVHLDRLRVVVAAVALEDAARVLLIANEIAIEDAGAGGVDAGTDSLTGVDHVLIAQDVGGGGLWVTRGGDAIREVRQIRPRLRFVNGAALSAQVGVRVHEPRHDGGAGHVTLLAGVTKNVQAKYFPDITSIRDLAAVAGLPKPAEKHQVQAQAKVLDKAILLDPDKDFLIPEFDIEIDIDLENSLSAFQDSGLTEVEGKDRVYLYGFGIHDRTSNKDWHSAAFDSLADYSNTEDGEYQLLLKMWNFLKDHVAQAEAAGKSIGIFHYSSHEKTWWRNFARNHEGKSGVPTLEEVDDFTGDYFVDLLDYSKQVALGTTGYGIKKLAPKAGFNWQVQDPGGALSLLKYKDAVDQNRSQAERDESIAWLYSYNLDDVRATFAVRDYLRNLTF